jgi:hypothetical protein
VSTSSQNPEQYRFVVRGHGDISADVVNDPQLGTALWIQTSVDGCYLTPDRIDELAEGLRHTAGMTPSDAHDARDELQSRIYDSLVAFNSVACWDILRLAQMRQHLAEHLADAFAEQAAEIDRLRTELKQTAGHRDYWHAELMCADARILELGRKVPKAGDR